MEPVDLILILCALLLNAVSVAAVGYAVLSRLRSRAPSPDAPQKEPVSKLDTLGIDLRGREQPVFPTVLPPDGKTLSLRVPTKLLADTFSQIGDLLQRVNRKRHTLQDVDRLYSLTAALLSNNIEGQSFPPEAVAERLTPDDVAALLTAYMEWLSEIIQSKN